MQTILSLDISSNPAHAIVAEIDGRSIQVIEKHSLELNGIFSQNTEAEIAADNKIIAESENQADDIQIPAENPISKLLAKIQSNWSNAILTISADEYLALNMNLPFGDNKSINRILDLEVQDLVPFDIEDFHLSHKSIAPIGENNDSAYKFDIHVGLISKRYIEKIMLLCQQANFEPLIVSTPPSVLGSVINLAPNYFSENSLIIFERLPYYYIISSFDGLLRNERVLLHPNFLPSLNGDKPSANLSEGNKKILLDLKLFLSNCEKRYNKQLDKIYFFGNGFTQNEIQNTAARTTEVLNLSELVPLSDENSQIALMAAVYAQDNNVSQIISNFRTRKYAYNQKIKYLLQGLKSLLPIASVFLLCLLIFFSCLYFINSFKINRLNSAINSQIRASLPALKISKGEELKVLQAENLKLEEQLKDISSLSSLTPLDMFLAVSRDLPESLGVTISAVRIRDNKIFIDGSAKAYSDVDNIKRILDQNPLYERVRRSDGGGGTTFQGRRNFSFEIWVKE